MYHALGGPMGTEVETSCNQLLWRHSWYVVHIFYDYTMNSINKHVQHPNEINGRPSILGEVRTLCR